MPFHSESTIKPEWGFIYLVHQRFLDLTASDLITAGGKVFKTFQNRMLWGSSLPINNFFPQVDLNILALFSVPKGWLYSLSSLTYIHGVVYMVSLFL